MEAPQRCLYEVLGVDRTSSSDDIRSAYRKLALKWHPDKIQQSGASPQACEEATVLFQEIGRAYEVLSDPSERSWYDSHRSQILNRASPSSSSSPSDYEFNPWPYFSPSAFSGYGDSGKGFYAVYGKLFADLHTQEQGFARSHGLKMPLDPPEMGGISTPYAHVQKFYSFWLSFGTVKDFSWCDEYRPSDGFNRKVRRLMEEENKKLRSKARKEFNEAIRRLAAFVKKRDKRVLERQLEVQLLEKQKEEMLKLKRKKEEEEKKMKAKLYEEAEWTKVSRTEFEMDDDGSDIDDSIGSYGWASKNTESKKERQDEEFYCIVCSKKFKSDKQWKNHERSKKHLERVASLKESFKEEDEEMRGIFSMQEWENNEATSVSGMRGTRHRGGGNGMEYVKSCSGVEDEDANHVDSMTQDYGGDDERKSLLSRKELDEAQTSDSVSGSDEETNKKNRNGEREREVEQVEEEEEEEEEKEEEEEEEEEGEEEEEEKEEGEEMLLAMVRSRYSVEQSEDDQDHENEDGGEMLMAMMKPRYSKKPPEDELENVDDGNICVLSGNSTKTKKKKSKTSLRNERKQADHLNRHAALIRELSLENDINKVVLQSATLGIEENESSFVDQESQSTTAIDGNDNADVEASVDKCEQIKVFKGVTSSKGSRVAPQTDAPRVSAKAKKNKGKMKNATNTCEICGEDFESRNQLFKHISITKHAILKGK